MRLQSIKFNKFGKLDDFTIEFNKPHNSYFGNLSLSVLVGENGTGKTTLLRFLSLVFNRDNFRHLLPEFFEVRYVNENYQHLLSNQFHPEVLPKKIIVSTYSPFETYYYKKKKKYHKPLQVKYEYLGARVGSQRDLSSVFLPILEAYYLNNNDDRKAKSIDNLLNHIGFVDAKPLVGLNLHNLGAETLIKKISNHKLSESEKSNAYILYKSLFSYRYEEPKAFTLIESLRPSYRNDTIINPLSLHSYKGGLSSWLEDVKRLEDITNFKLISNLYFPKNGKIVPISEFSSGELSLFYRFFSMIDVMTDNAIVLIDEPEIHLHPKWMQKYVQIVKDVFKHYHSHFILATHSPFIAYDVPNECIIGLFEDADNKVKEYKVDYRTMGTSTREILKFVFQLENYQGGLTTELITKIKSLLDQGNLAAADSLYDDLGNSNEKYSIYLKIEKAKERNKEEGEFEE